MRRRPEVINKYASTTAFVFVSSQVSLVKGMVVEAAVETVNDAYNTYQSNQESGCSNETIVRAAGTTMGATSAGCFAVGNPIAGIACFVGGMFARINGDAMYTKSQAAQAQQPANAADIVAHQGMGARV